MIIVGDVRAAYRDNYRVHERRRMNTKKEKKRKPPCRNDKNTSKIKINFLRQKFLFLSCRCFFLFYILFDIPTAATTRKV